MESLLGGGLFALFLVAQVLAVVALQGGAGQPARGRPDQEAPMQHTEFGRAARAIAADIAADAEWLGAHFSRTKGPAVSR